MHRVNIFLLLWKDWHVIHTFVYLLLQIFFICISHRWELCVTKLHYAFIYTNSECQLLKHVIVWRQLRKSCLLCTQEIVGLCLVLVVPGRPCPCSPPQVNRLLQNYSAINTKRYLFTARMFLWCMGRLGMRAFCFCFFFWIKPLQLVMNSTIFKSEIIGHGS